MASRISHSPMSDGVYECIDWNEHVATPRCLRQQRPGGPEGCSVGISKSMTCGFRSGGVGDLIYLRRRPFTTYSSQSARCSDHSGELDLSPTSLSPASPLKGLLENDATVSSPNLWKSVIPGADGAESLKSDSPTWRVVEPHHQIAFCMHESAGTTMKKRPNVLLIVADGKDKLVAVLTLRSRVL